MTSIPLPIRTSPVPPHQHPAAGAHLLAPHVLEWSGLSRSEVRRIVLDILG